MREQRRTIRDIHACKAGGRKIVCLTSYTAPVAKIADRHADVILVGDSLGMVLYGFKSTLQVTLDMMILHGRAVADATEKAFVVVDMPFGAYQESPEQAFRHAAQIMSETGCGAVKLEGGAEMAETVSFLSARGIPVMGHTGLQPQSVNAAGGYRVMGRTANERKEILDNVKALDNAGAFAIVLECVDEDIAITAADTSRAPVIGIGASVHCDGQVLVAEDILGMADGKTPKFVKRYADLAGEIDRAVAAYAEEVRECAFPDPAHTYPPESGKLPRLRTA